MQVMKKTIERYLHTLHDKDRQRGTEVAQHVQHLKHESAFMVKKIELLENTHRKLLGHNLGNCSMGELQEIDNQLERSLDNIRARKSQLFKEEMERLLAKEKFLLEENARLSEKFGLRTRNGPAQQKTIGPHSQNSDVVTELFIGPPTTRN
ncbi:hypothetical protein CASFOL_006869 [Castilleja foliolosa]|uniref:K-box domain-containing protein n=1 Tax=Castilleja foliolosa TaxID=1961234 RepID=A0ABD3E7Q1_9LAMI